MADASLHGKTVVDCCRDFRLEGKNRVGHYRGGFEKEEGPWEKSRIKEWGARLAGCIPPPIPITQAEVPPERISYDIARRVSRQEGLGRGNGFSRPPRAGLLL